MKRSALLISGLIATPVAIIIVAGSAVLLYYLYVGCTQGNAVTQKELLGTWTANHADPPETIELKTQSRYVHRYSLPNGNKSEDEESWDLESPARDPKINLHKFALFRPGRQSYTCDDDLKIPVEPWLNKHRIIVDEDENLFFEK